MTFHGQWNEGGQFRWGNEVGSFAGATFEGTGVKWIGWKFDDAGIAEVSIDGNAVAKVDQYGPGRGLPFDWSFSGLASGKHTIRITLLEEKNPAS